MHLLNQLTIPRGDARYLQVTHEVTCLSGDAVGSPVYAAGEPVGEIWNVATANPLDDLKMPAIGLLVEKMSPTSGRVQLFGPCDLFTGMDRGRPLLVGPYGNLIEEVPPLMPGFFYWGQQIGVAVGDSLLMLYGNQRMIRYTG